MNRGAAHFMTALASAVMILASLGAFAAPGRSLALQHLGTDAGLTQGTVNTTLQDSQGFVWLGTEDGLIRYDGHEVRRYASSSRSADALPGNFIFSLAEDKNGDVWIAVKGAGLARWNRSSDTFSVFRHDDNDPRTISSDFVRRVMVDSQNRIWVGTLDAGVDVLDPTTGHIAHLDHRADIDSSLISNEVYSLMEDRRGKFWIGTVSGVDRWSFDGSRFTRSGFQKAGAALLTGNKIEQLADANDETFWAGSFESGVFQLDYSGQILQHLRHQAGQPDSLSSDEVHAVLDDHAGHLWIGTADGLDALNQSTKRIEHYVHDISDPTSLSDSFVMSLYEDGSGLLWIGTRAGGVNRLNARSWEFGVNRPAWLAGKSVTAFADGPGDELWVGTLGAGLFNVDLGTGVAKSLDALLQTNDAVGDRRIMSLHRDRRGDLWIGTLAAGLKKLSADGRLTSIPVHPGDLHALSAAGIAAIYEASNGPLWIGTHGGGVNILDPTTGTIRQLPFLPDQARSTSSANITSFAEDLNGRMWIGTENGVNLADADGVIQNFVHKAGDSSSLSSNVVYALSRDGAGRVWIATDGGGLNLAIGSASNPRGVKFTSLSSAEGLSSDTLYAVVPDEDGFLWLSGNVGLMRFDPSTHAIQTYHREHGLQGEEFNSGAYLRRSDGRLCFGGPDGFNIFRPAQISTTSGPPRIVLTRIEVLGAPAHESTAFWQLRDIPLDYQASVVSFDFAVLDFTSPTRNRLSYRMAGLTDKWIDLDSQHRVTLTNLDAGDHLLEVRAATADSPWSAVPFQLAIHKQAAPWRSRAAFTVYGAFVVLLVVSGIQVQRHKLRRAVAAKIELESVIALRTRELREANRQLTVAGEAKSDFLSRMGHELRTPMNGVVGMTELMARSALSPVQARQIQTIRSSARTLLQMLNDLLDFSKAQAGKIALECLPLDLNRLVEESVATFAGSAEMKRLDLIVAPLVDRRRTFHGDPLRLQQIIMNLIGNAVKFTEQGEVVVTTDVFETEVGKSCVVISIADTGIGIEPAGLERLFEPFSQADETTTRRFGGSGLGLSICQELTRLMGGTIDVASRPRGGSTFTVSLPLKAVENEDRSVTGWPEGTTLIVMTRRRALREALIRHAGLLELPSRCADPAPDTPPAENEVILLDADSYPSAVDYVAVSWPRNQVIIIASSSAADEQRLETRVPHQQLLRGLLERESMYRAVRAATACKGATAHAPALSGSALPQFSAHVLLVEDDDVNAAVAAGYLAALGCSSTWAVNGETAIARSTVERFDLILMDLNMPGLDGYQTTRHIREQEPPGRRVPVIALTASNAAEHRTSCFAAGMDDVLTKPYTLAECAALLRRWVDHKARRARGCESTRGLQDLTVLDEKIVQDLQKIGSFAPSALFSRLVDLFAQNSANAFEDLSAAIKADDFSAARALAHKFKGAATNVGALQFAAQLAALELACADDRTAVAPIHESLAAARVPLIDELRRRSSMQTV